MTPLLTALFVLPERVELVTVNVPLFLMPLPEFSERMHSLTVPVLLLSTPPPRVRELPVRVELVMMREPATVSRPPFSMPPTLRSRVAGKSGVGDCE